MENIKNMTPQEIVNELDKYIIGQKEAKRNVAIALRNRWRRLNVNDEIKNEIIPNNILMIGATGCLLYTSPSPRDVVPSRMPSSA